MSKKILVIDDEEGLGNLIKLNIENEFQYEVILARNGERGHELAVEQEPDLVLLDVMMPGINGLETLKRIKGSLPHVPVAMVTAVWNAEEAKRCFEAGAYEYITKPIDLEQLKMAVMVKLFDKPA